MAIYFKFKSARNFETIAVPGNGVCIGYLKDIIRKKKGLLRGRDYDLLVYNAQTGEEYVDEYAMVPKFTSVLVRRISGPRLPSLPIISVDNSITTDSATVTTSDQIEFETDDFGEDVFAMPKVEMKTKALVDKDSYATPKVDTKTKASLDTKSCSNGSSGISSGSGGRHGFPRMTPPVGYICHRCKVPGHFIQHCPTNGDPSYDIKKPKAPTAVSSTRTVSALPPELLQLPTVVSSTQTASALPPELLCPLCRELMKDAALTKCCFKSFCDRCIRNYLSSKSTCVCGSMKSSIGNIVPNVTVREIINRLLVSVSSSGENSGSLKVEDAESANNKRVKVVSPIHSGVIEDERMDSLDENGGGAIVDDVASKDVESANSKQLKAISPTLSVRIKEELKDSFHANKGDMRIKRHLPDNEHSAGMCLASSVYSNSCGKGVPMGIDAYMSSSDFRMKRMRLI